MRQIANKWAKFMVLKRHRYVAAHIPDTRPFSEDNLRDMLGRYSFVVAKPVIGTGGSGVVKIERAGGGTYRYHYNRIKKTFDSFSGLMRRLNRIRRGRKYLIQRGIPLLTIGGRPVDYRVKKVKFGRKWRTTAIVARVAHQGQFVTNLCRGGYMLTGFKALRHSFSARTSRKKKSAMRSLADTSTYLLERRYPGIGSLGFDFGVDRNGCIWIFEVNTRPH